MYFLATSDEVISGPYFNIDQAYVARFKLHPIEQQSIKIYTLNGQFDLEEV